MRLIIEIENDDDLAKVRALMTGLSFSSVEVQSPQEKLRSFVRWCQENEILVKELKIPTREERSARYSIYRIGEVHFRSPPAPLEKGGAGNFQSPPF